jgi:predicted phage baseplate assembly protein
MIYDCCNENRKNAVLNNPSIVATPTIDAAGSGYAVGDVLTIAQSGSSGSATVTVSAASSTGGVTGISLTQNGTLYGTASGVPTTGGKGTGCTLNLVCAPNGIDYLEVAWTPGSELPPSLSLHLLKPLTSTIGISNVLISGGESITGIAAASISAGSAPNILVIQTSKAGDFSSYTLRVVNSAQSASEDSFEVTEVLAGFDPQLAEVSFSFRLACEPQFDCNPQVSGCPPSLPTPPPINYLAKDYGSFRTLILDRLNQLLPSWGATTEADLGIVLAELIAYKADLLSYQQDAVATEAYLETARSRISLRRHALLMDYHVHDGCNARAWMHLTVAGNTGDAIFMDRTLTRFYTYAPGMPSSLAVGAGNEQAALAAGVQVFQPMQDATLYPEHNAMSFYTWGDANCCLPQGATEATLAGSFPNLVPGAVLIFAEVIGPQTGNPADADLRHRCAVRLTQVTTRNAAGAPLVDPLFDTAGNPMTSPTQTPQPVTEIQWSQDDALTLPVCLSSTYLSPENGALTTAVNVSVAYGNVVLADHGLSIAEVTPSTVPEPSLFYPSSSAADRCSPTAPAPLPVRFRPTLEYSPLTQAVPLPLTGSPVTPGVVLLSGTAPVSLTDSNGFTALRIQAANPANWPALFGVIVKQNATTSTNFDLAVVYDPPNPAVGVTAPVVLEQFTNLTFTTTAANYVVTQINTASRLIQIPSGYTPPSTAPAGYSSTVTRLSPTGAVNLQDTSSSPVTFLTVEANAPAGWPAYIGVLAQSAARQPACCAAVRPTFSLEVVYDPPTGGQGVTLPVTLENLAPSSQPAVAGSFSPGSQLIAVETFAEAPNLSLSAYDLTHVNAGDAVPEICLCGTYDGVTSPWTPQQDLLGNDASDQVFVVETDSDGTSTLRFATPADANSSETTNGMVPPAGTSFLAGYRVGNGTAGNVGAESLIYLAASDARIQSCKNPMPAAGGTDPETDDQIRRRAPQAYLAQERSVTMADYENAAEGNPQVDQAVASLRWTGSWYSVFVAVEPSGGGNLTPSLQKSLLKSVNASRLAGQDLKLESPQYVLLAITLQVCVASDYFQSDVEEALLQVLGNRMLPNGQKGIFFPDNFTFGQTVYLSPVYAAARSVPGVVQVTATQFQPQDVNTSKFLQAGEIKLSSLQIARLDNDPSLPDHGQLTLVMQGGK